MSDSNKQSVSEKSYLFERPTADSLPAVCREFLTFLAFEGQGIRVGLEISLCFFIYTFLSLTFPWHLLNLNVTWGALYSWFIACISVTVFDQAFLFRPAYNYRTSLKLEVAGLYDRALQLLETIGPSSSHFVRCPARLYHLRRAEIMSNKGLYQLADIELQLAKNNGLDHSRFHLARAAVWRAQGKSEEALVELEAIRKIFGENPVVRFESALVLWDQKKDLWQAKRKFKEVAEDVEVFHPIGESTKVLGHAYWNVLRLTTGEAEVGIEELEYTLERIYSSALRIDTLRPLVAELLLCRSHYFATHKEPQLALADLARAVGLCSHPRLARRAEEIKDELAWRFSLPTVKKD